MEIYDLKIPAKPLAEAVKQLHRLLSKIKPKPGYPILDVVIGLNRVELRLIGMSQFISINHSRVLSFTIPFHNFYALSLGTTKENFIAEVFNGKLKVGNREVSSDFIKIFHPENLQKFNLVINSGALDILALRNKFSEEELKDKNYLEIVEREEQKIETEIHKALEHLAPYGITYRTLKKIIEQNIINIE